MSHFFNDNSPSQFDLMSELGVELPTKKKKKEGVSRISFSSPRVGGKRAVERAAERLAALLWNSSPLTRCLYLSNEGCWLCTWRQKHPNV